MPASEVLRKQNMLGAVAGTALLAFALAWRFLPQWLPQTPEPVAESVEPDVAAIEGFPRAGRPRSVAVEPIPPETGVAPTEEEFVGPPDVAAPEPTEEWISETEQVAPPSAEIADLLKKGDRAIAAHRLLEPKGDNALAHYQAVLGLDADNAAARAGIEKISDLIRDQTVEALDLGQAQEAEKLIGRLEALGHDAEEVDGLRARYALIEKVSPLLAKAAEHMLLGRMSQPPGANALDLFREVLALDPANSVALQGLAQVEKGFLDRALAALAEEKFADAEAILDEAAPINPGSQALLEARARVVDVRRQRAEGVLAQARSALDSGDAALAATLLARAEAMSSDVAGVQEMRARLENARLYASLSPGQAISDSFLDSKGTAPELVVIATGKFRMGSPDKEKGRQENEGPQRDVQIQLGFALGRTEVTVAQFRHFVKATSYQSDAERLGGSSFYDESSGRMSERANVLWKDDYRGERAADKLPVVHVSFNDANAYVAWLTERTGRRYRLPSEAEFEYALRAGSSKRYWWGDSGPSRVLANVTGDGDRSASKRSWTKAFPRYSDGHWGPAPVGSFPLNAFQLADMDGNVSEWTADCWHDSYVRAPREGQAWVNPGCKRQVIRGGSWGSAPDQLRSAFRLSAQQQTRSARVGFRVARDL